MFVTQDFSKNKNNTKGKIFCFFFRIVNYAKKHPSFKLPLSPFLILYKGFFEWIVGIEIPYNVTVGRGFQVLHFQAIVINKNTVIGENCRIRHGLTIGNRGDGTGSPVIGNNVTIGAQVCIIGPIRVGNNVTIGAGSVVVKDVPDDCVIAGNPARIIKMKN